MRLELVRWRDAHFSIDDNDTDNEDYIMETPGWVREDGRWLRIEGEHGPDGMARAVTRVPLENVVARVPLYSKDQVDEWNEPAI